MFIKLDKPLKFSSHVSSDTGICEFIITDYLISSNFVSFDQNKVVDSFTIFKKSQGFRSLSADANKEVKVDPSKDTIKEKNETNEKKGDPAANLNSNPKVSEVAQDKPVLQTKTDKLIADYDHSNAIKNDKLTSIPNNNEIPAQDGKEVHKPDTDLKPQQSDNKKSAISSANTPKKENKTPSVEDKNVTTPPQETKPQTPKPEDKTSPAEDKNVTTPPKETKSQTPKPEDKTSPADHKEVGKANQNVKTPNNSEEVAKQKETQPKENAEQHSNDKASTTVNAKDEHSTKEHDE